MLIFSSPEDAVRAGFSIVDYDVERQLFIVEKGERRHVLRAKSQEFTVVLEDEARKSA